MQTNEVWNRMRSHFIGHIASAESRNAWLDVCRSLAIILVLLSHGRHFLTPVWEWAAVFRIGGFLGVELFFVLSGFLIGGIVARDFERAVAGRGWLGRFFMRRWLRTLPNYYLFLGINAVLVVAEVVPGRLRDLLPFLFFGQNLAWPGPAIFGEAWSLAVEEVFYMVFPLCLYWFGKSDQKRESVFVSVVVLLLVIPLLLRALIVLAAGPTWDEGVRKVVVFRLDALMVGVLASLLVRRAELITRYSVCRLVAASSILLGASIVAFFSMEKSLNHSVFARVWLFPLVSSGCVTLLLSGLMYGRWFHWLKVGADRCARWSYALYLSHMVVFHLITHFCDVTTVSAWQAAANWGVFVGASFCVAALVERFFERPILRWRETIQILS